jgi:hypothetical protein
VDLLRRLRPGAPGTEPERSLEQLREQGTWLHLGRPDGPPRHARHEPDLQVAWWWHRGARTVVLGRQVVSILGPTGIERRPLRFLGAAQIAIVGRGGPSPGEVERAQSASLTFDPHVPAWDATPATAPATPPDLAPLLGRTVELRVAGGHTVEHRGALERDGTDELPAPRGRLEAAVVGHGHVVLVLDDLTVAVLHEPLAVQVDGGAVQLAGDLGRVVLDLPTPEVHVARDATLLVRPIDGATA